MSSITYPSVETLTLSGSEWIVRGYDDESKYIVSYSCQALVSTNIMTPFTVNFFYDLLFTGGDATAARKEFEYLLLQAVAEQYELVSGDACLSPPLEGNFYITQVSSLPEDVPTDVFAECFDLTPAPGSGEECLSYAGSMTGLVAGVDDTLELLDFIAKSINDGSVIRSGSGRTTFNLTASFLGTHIDPQSDGRDNLAAPINEVTIPKDAIVKDKTFTPVGVLMVLGLCSAFCGLVFVFFRMRRRRRLEEWREENNFKDENIQATKTSTTDVIGNSGKQMGDEAYELPSNYAISDMASEPENGEVYQFDLDKSLTRGILGVHGERPAPTNKYNNEGSESDNDSWAQTDATLGSLDVRPVLGGETSEI